MSLALKLGLLCVFFGIIGWGYVLMARIQLLVTRVEQACEINEMLVQRVELVMVQDLATAPQPRVDLAGGLPTGKHHKSVA